MTLVTFTDKVVNTTSAGHLLPPYTGYIWLEMKSGPAQNYVHGVPSLESTTLTQSLIGITDSLSCLNVLMNNLTCIVLLNTSHTSLHDLHNYAGSDSPKMCITEISSLQAAMLICSPNRNIHMHKAECYNCEQVLFVRLYNNPAPVIRSMQFHYCTVSNPGTGADDAFVLKHGV